MTSTTERNTSERTSPPRSPKKIAAMLRMGPRAKTASRMMSAKAATKATTMPVKTGISTGADRTLKARAPWMPSPMAARKKKPRTTCIVRRSLTLLGVGPKRHSRLRPTPLPP
jgi:hypothetical protein